MARQWTKTSGAAYYELKSSAAAQPEGADPVRCVLVVYRRKGMDEAYRHALAAGLAQLVLFREPREGELWALERAPFRRLGRRLLSNTLTPDGAIVHFQK